MIACSPAGLAGKRPHQEHAVAIEAEILGREIAQRPHEQARHPHTANLPVQSPHSAGFERRASRLGHSRTFPTQKGVKIPDLFAGNWPGIVLQ